MAHFSYLSSPDSDDSAVENLISQSVDLSALEQIAALNSLASDSVLPTDLETRFHKLKSLPRADRNLKNPHPSLDLSPEKKRKHRSPNPRAKSPTTSLDEDFDSNALSFSDDEPVKPGVVSQRNLLKSSIGSRKYPDSTPDKEIENSIPAKLNAVKDTNPETRSGTFSSPSISFNSSIEAASSPPQQTCCVWCSPKKVSRKKSKDDTVVRLNCLDLDNGHWGKGDEILTSLSSLSLKDQQRRMKKILKAEEEMVSREAEKVLKWAKQASARMDVSSLEGSPSNDEKFK